MRSSRTRRARARGMVLSSVMMSALTKSFSTHTAIQGNEEAACRRPPTVLHGCSLGFPSADHPQDEQQDDGADERDDDAWNIDAGRTDVRSEEHTSELQ